jgi:hypothetical protein
MTGALLSFVLRGFGWLGSVTRALGRWLFADWRNAVMAVLGLNLAAHIFWIVPGLRTARDVAEAKFAAESRAHRQTAQNARDAARQAQLAAEANVRRVASEQARATKRIVDDFERRIAHARARAVDLGRLRSGRAASTNPRSADTADLSSAANAARRADETSSEAGFFDPGIKLAPLAEQDRLICTEQAIQLDALIDYVRAIGSIPNSVSPSAIAGVDVP